MPNKKSFFDQFVAFAACFGLIISILGAFREDASARARDSNDIEILKKAAPGIEERLDKIESLQAAIVKSQENMTDSIKHLQSSVDDLRKP